MAQGLGLGLQVSPEFGQILVYGGKHGIQSRPLHPGALQGLVQGGFIAPKLCGIDGLQLDGVEGKGHRIFDLIIAGQLRLIGGLAHCRISVIGQVPDGGEVGDTAIVIHLHRTGEVCLQVAPGAGAGQLHPGHNILALASQ